MFLVIGIITFILIALFLPRFALVVFIAWSMHWWANPWALFGAIGLAIIALILDVLVASD